MLFSRLGYRRLRSHFIRPTALDGFIAFYLAAAAVALLISPLPQVGLPKLTVMILGVFGYYLVQEWLADEPAYLAYLAGILAAGGGAIALLGLLLVEWPRRQIFNLQVITDHLPQLGGSFAINSNELAGALVLLLPFGLVRWRPRPVALALALVMAAVLLLTQSRTALLALAAAGLTAVIWGRFRLRWLVVVSLTPLLLIFLLLLLTPLDGNEISSWFVTLDASSKSGRTPAVSWLARREIWQAALAMMRDYPVVGSGLYTFEPVSRLNYTYLVIPPTVPLTHAHNLFLEAAATTGWPALLALLGLFLTAGAGLWQSAHSFSRPETRHLAVAFAASLVGYVGFNLLDAVTLGQKPGLFAWLALAGAATLLPPEGRLVRYGQAAPLLLLGLLCLTPALGRNRANLALDRLRLVADSKEMVADLPALPWPGDPRRSGIVAFLGGDTEQAFAYWQSDPGAVDFLTSQTIQLATQERYGEAAGWSSLALRLDEQAAWAAYWRGVSYEQLGETELAIADYETAARYGEPAGMSLPWQAAFHYAWGRLLALDGRWPAAQVAFEQATILDPETPSYYRWLGDSLKAMGDEVGASAAYAESEKRAR